LSLLAICAILAMYQSGFAALVELVDTPA